MTPTPIKPTRTAPIPAATTSRCTAVARNFDALPDSALVRQSDLVRSPKHPGNAAPLPFSAASLWRKVAAGTFPKPVKLGERTTCWKVADVRRWMAQQEVA